MNSPGLERNLHPCGSLETIEGGLMLTDRQQETKEYLGARINKITREGKEKMWMRNIQKNKPFYMRGNPIPKGLATYLIGAGPSLDKNIDELKNMGGRGVVVCIDANLKYLMDKGIKPEYCVSIDASGKIWDMVKHVIDKTKDITLVCTTAANPKLIKRWKGNRFFFITPHKVIQSKTDEMTAMTRYIVATKDIKVGKELLFNKNYKIKFSGVMLELPCGGNVTTSAHMFCIACLKAISVVFVGCDFSWKDSSHFYAGNEHIENTKGRTLNEQIFSHPDSNGDKVNTNISLDSFKRWHEQLALHYEYSCINATEGGILGINSDGKKEPFMAFSTLKDAIAELSPKENGG